MQTDLPTTIQINDNQTDDNDAHQQQPSYPSPPRKKRRKRANLSRYSRLQKRKKEDITSPTKTNHTTQDIATSPTRTSKVTHSITPSPPLKPPKPSYRPTPLISIPTPKTRPARNATTLQSVDIVNVDDYLLEMSKSQDVFGDGHKKIRNYSIAYVYQHCYAAPPPEDWGGSCGTVMRLINFFRIPKKKRRQVRRILMEVWQSILEQREYNHNLHSNSGRTPMVAEGDPDEDIIANWMEQGLGFRHTLAMVNQSRVERGLIHIGISALIFAFRRMNPIIKNQEKRAGKCEQYSMEESTYKSM